MIIARSAGGPRPTSPYGPRVGDRAFEHLLAEMAAAAPADITYARCMAAIEQAVIAGQRLEDRWREAYQDGIYSKAARAMRLAAEERFSEGTALAECASALEARPDDPVDVDLRHDSNVPAPRRKAAEPMLLLPLVAA